MILEPEVETRPWAEQLALDDTAFREQLAYLRERSPFYREKLAGRDDVGLADIARLPLTEKRELRTSDAPLGRHLCVEPSEIVRIYSTSGTTGRPSYIPLTAQDLENWIVGSARSYAASGVEPGERIVSTYNAGPFVAGAALAAFDRIGLTHIPVGTGNSERLLQAIDELRPEAVVLTPSYAAYLAERESRLVGSSVRRVLVAGEPGGGEPRFRARLQEGWGAKVTEAMGIGDIGVSLWGECEEQNGMHLGARSFVHPELIDAATAEPVPLEEGATGELVLSHLRQRARAAAALPHARPRPDHTSRRLSLRAHRADDPVRRPDRRHADRPRRQRVPFGGPRGRRRVRAGRERARPGQAGGAGREAGPAASGRGRARRRSPRRRGALGSDP